MHERRQFPKINISAIPVAGVGGLGLMAVVGIMAVALMEVRVFLIAAFVAGSVLGLVLIMARRGGGAGTWSGPSAHVFFENEVPTGSRGRRSLQPPHRELRLAVR